jgi:hypothetical protein
MGSSHLAAGLQATRARNFFRSLFCSDLLGSSVFTSESGRSNEPLRDNGPTENSVGGAVRYACRVNQCRGINDAGMLCVPRLKSLLPRDRPSGLGTDPSRLFAALPVAIHPPSANGSDGSVPIVQHLLQPHPKNVRGLDRRAWPLGPPGATLVAAHITFRHTYLAASLMPRLQKFP